MERKVYVVRSVANNGNLHIDNNLPYAYTSIANANKGVDELIKIHAEVGYKVVERTETYCRVEDADGASISMYIDAWEVRLPASRVANGVISIPFAIIPLN